MRDSIKCSMFIAVSVVLLCFFYERVGAQDQGSDSILSIVTDLPLSLNIGENETRTLTFSVRGATPVTFTWYRNRELFGTPETGTALTNTVQITKGGRYNCIASNANSSVNSGTCEVTETSPITITSNLPSSLSLVSGQSGTLSITVSGTPPMTYTWYRNSSQFGTPQTNSNLTNAVSVTEAGTYHCVITNTAGASATSQSCQVTVGTAVNITTDLPLTLTLTDGQSHTLSITVSGTPPMTYTWYRNNSQFGTSQTNNNLTNSIAVSEAGSYYCVVTNNGGTSSATSQHCQVTVNAPVHITADLPPSLSLTSGQNDTISITVSGTPPMTYTWYRNNSQFGTSQTSNNLTHSITVSEAGSYYCVVTNNGGTSSATSQGCQVTVNTSITIVNNLPSTLPIISGQSGTLSITVSGTPPMTYAWYRDNSQFGTPQTSDNLTNSISITEVGTYHCVITNASGSITSQNCQVTVIVPVTIQTNVPPTLSITANQSGTLLLTVSGTPPMTYSWFRNSTPFGNPVTTNTLTNSIQVTDSGSYYCTISNAAGSITTQTCRVTIHTPLAIMQDLPATLELTEGQSRPLSITVAGDVPLTYTWYRDGALFGNPETSSNLTATRQVSDSGQYYCIVSNATASANSRICQVTVNSGITIITNLPPRDTIIAGQSITLSVTVTGTRPMTYIWYKDSAPLGAPETTNSLTSSRQIQETGSYHCVVNNTVNSVTTATCVVISLSAPVSIVTDLPATLPLEQGGSVSLLVTVSGSTPLTYTWFRNGSQFGNPVTSNNTSNTIQATEVGSYHCMIRNSVNADTTRSCQVQLTATPVRIVADIPANMSVEIGKNASLTVSVSGSTPMTYVWYKDKVKVSEQTTSTLSNSYTITNAALQNSGDYYCTVSNSASGSNPATTTTCKLQVISNPIMITSNLPAQITLDEGQSQALTVQVTGSVPIKYEWFKGAVLLTSQEGTSLSSSYQIKDATIDASGQYYCTMTNAAGSVTTQRCNVQVIKAQPVTITANPVSVNQWERKAASFSVTATGSTPISYQWYKDGIALSGATQPQLTILSVTQVNVGEYYCEVSNRFGSARSTAARLTIRQAVDFTAHPPAKISKKVNESVTITVTATGEQPIYYRWQKYYQNTGSWADLTAQNPTPSFTIASVQTQNSGLYRCVANNEGSSMISSHCELIVSVPMTVIKDLPDTLKAWSGSLMSLTFSVSGTAPITYQWRKNGTVIERAKQALYSIPSCVASDSGLYFCTAADANDSVISSKRCKVSIGRKAMITSVPQSQTVHLNEKAQFSIEAQGDQPMWYQWQKETENLPGQTSSRLEIQNVKMQDVGTYRCIATNNGGSDTSRNAKLDITGPLMISDQPQSATIYSGRKFSCRVGATGIVKIGYQWQMNGIDIPGAVSESFTIEKTAKSDAGEYVCVVRDLSSGSGSVIRSAAAVLTVFETVNIVTQPQSVKKRIGEKAVFSVVVNGQKPISYQWQKNGGDITSARDSIFTIASVTSSDAGLYQCIVGNGGDTITSAAATLIISGPAQFITTQAADTLWTGRSDTLSVQVSGDDPIVYTWFKDGVQLPDSGRLLIFKNITSIYSGKYSCIAENALGKDTSAEIAVSVFETVFITKQPEATSVFEGNSAQFVIVVGGYSPFTYQWYFKLQSESDTFVMPGETSSELRFVRATKADEKNYYCIISNGGGSVRSQYARLTIENPGLLLMVPNGGERWYIGEKKTIRWRFNGAVDSVKILFSNVGGSNWSIIEERIKNTGEYLWSIPYTISSSCKIYVSDLDGVPADESDNCFLIANITPIINPGAQKKGNKPVNTFVITPNPTSRNEKSEVSFRLISQQSNRSAELIVADGLGSIVLRTTCPLTGCRIGEPVKIATWTLNRSSRGYSKVGAGSYLAILRVNHSDGSQTVLRQLIGIKE